MGENKLVDTAIVAQGDYTLRAATSSFDIVVYIGGHDSGIRLKPNGTSEIFGDYTPDEAAKVFWDTCLLVAPPHWLARGETKADE